MRVAKDFIEYSILEKNLKNFHISEFIIKMSRALNSYIVENKITPENFEEVKKTNLNFRSYYGGLKSGCVRGLKKKFKEQFVILMITNENFDKSNINSVFINDMVYKIFNEKIDNNSMSKILSEFSVKKAKRGECFVTYPPMFSELTIKRINLIMKGHLKKMKEEITKLEISFVERKQYKRTKI